MLNNKHESIYWWIPIEKRGGKPEKQPENRYSWNPKVHMKEWEILSVLNFVKDPEFMERCSEHYPEMTTKEIKKILVDQQEDYTIYDIIHQHEWISEDVINKYVCRSKYFPEDLSEYIGNKPIKITVNTPEIHDCNLIKLAPELQKKAYWWHRWFNWWRRRTVSHLINREDFVWEDGKPLENKTSKLTVVAKIDKGNRWYDEPYILIITAFWWDGKAKKEIKADEYKSYEDADLDDMEYWLNHALIVENDESIEKIWSEPGWLNEYKIKKMRKLIYEKWKDLEYLRLFREIWEEKIGHISDESKAKIINTIKQIPLPHIEKDSDGSRLIEFKLWDKTRKILDPKLKTHSDDAYFVDDNYRFITDRDEWVELWWMLWEDVEKWENKELKKYVKEKQLEWLHIAKIEEIEELLKELWKLAGLDDIKDEIAMLMYLTGMDWRYSLSKGLTLCCWEDFRWLNCWYDTDDERNLCMISCE